MRRYFLTLLLLVPLLVSALKSTDLLYYDAAQFPLLGTAVPNASKQYSRLPDELHDSIRKELWDLGQNSAGLSIRFASDATAIGVKWKSLNKFAMNHMTDAGVRGVDLYVMQDDSTWTTVGSGRPTREKWSQSLIMSNMSRKMREYMLFLSLYDGIDSISIGVDSLAQVVQPQIDLPSRQKPVVMYGTSILQGGCANRPGMAHTNILQRELQREVYNFGFSGNARLDKEIAGVMAGIDAGCYVIDALPNCTAAMVTERMAEFYYILRSSHPDVPILFIESPLFPLMRFNEEVATEINAKNQALRDVYEGLQNAGEQNIYYFEGSRIFGGNVDATVDNYHFTDLGFSIYAANLLPVIKDLLR
jgi:hypothetical protein